MEEKVYLDTIEAINSENEQLKSENRKLRQYIEIRNSSSDRKRKVPKKGVKLFNMIYLDYAQKAQEKLSENALVLLAIISVRVNMNTNVVTNKNGIPLSLVDISKIIGWNKMKTSRALSELVENGILHKSNNGKLTYYVMSPAYCSCGNIEYIMEYMRENL
jgi:Fic family protein